jgi:hypothetical protein
MTTEMEPQAGLTPPAALPPARPSRPTVVTAASVILIVLGTLVSLLGIFVVLGGALIGSGIELDVPGLTAAVGGFVAVVGAIVLAFGLIELLSGIFALLGRAWARIVAIVIAVLGGLIALGGTFGSGTADASGLVVNLVLLACYVFVVGAMAASGRYFAER